MDPITGCFEKPNYITSYRSLIDIISLNCLVFQKITFLHFGVKIQDRISAIFDFMGPVTGSLKSPCTTSCMSSIETISLKCLVFEKIAFFCILVSRSKRTDFPHLGFYGPIMGSYFEKPTYNFL